MFHWNTLIIFVLDQVVRAWQSGIPLKYTVTITLVVITSGKITTCDISDAAGHGTILGNREQTCILTHQMKDQHSSQVHSQISCLSDSFNGYLQLFPEHSLYAAGLSTKDQQKPRKCCNYPVRGRKRTCSCLIMAKCRLWAEAAIAAMPVTC